MGRVGHGRSGALASSYAASNGGVDGAYGNFKEGGSVYGDSAWGTSDLEGSHPFRFGLGNGTSAVANKNASSYIIGYNVNSRQSNSGIAA